MADLIPIHRDFTALVPDGEVNRHVNVRLLFDPDTGEVTAQTDVNAARVAAGLTPHAEPAPADTTWEG
jgi:hypothetical protein